MRPIVIAVFGNASSTVTKIVAQLNAAGARAYYGHPDVHLRNPLVVSWSQGGNKIREMQRLTLAGVPTPRHAVSPVSGWIPRRTYHQEAMDFTNPPPVGDFWTEPTRTDHEFRVHVIHGVAFRLQHKYLPNGTTPLVKYGVPIRNHSLGWRFDPHPNCPDYIRTPVREAAVAAVRAVGYDMGAVDVGFIEPDRLVSSGAAGRVLSGPVVFEINTRPSMDDHTRGAYVEALLKLADQGSA